LTALYTGIVRVTRAVHFALLTAYRGIAWMAARLARAIRTVSWTIVGAVLKVASVILRTVDLVVTAVTTAVVFVATMIFRAFLNISLFTYTMVMVPVTRTTVAFRRTVLTIVMTTTLVATLVATGVYEAILRVTLPVASFLVRNIIAWHRVIFTISFLTTKIGIAIASAIVTLWNIMVTSFMASLRWVVLMLRNHYRGIRDISLLFSPGIGFGLAYLILGWTILLVLSIIWNVGIPITAYLYNRKNGAELNV
jgi:hypothetical protein